MSTFREELQRLWATPLVVMMLASCGESTSDTTGEGSGGTAGGGGVDSAVDASAYELCDGSPDLRFGYQVLGGGQMVLGTPLLTQNGFFYLVIDGTCRYWTFGSKEMRGWWQATHTGVLSPEQAVMIPDVLPPKSASGLEVAGAVIARWI